MISYTPVPDCPEYKKPVAFYSVSNGYWNVYETESGKVWVEFSQGFYVKRAFYQDSTLKEIDDYFKAKEVSG